MEIKTYNQDDILVISIDGNLDGSTAEYAQNVLQEKVTANCLFVIDMAKCPYVSSAGLRVLLITAKQLKKSGGDGVFIGLTDDVKDVMEMTGFSNIFNSYNDLNEAIDALRKEKIC